MFMVDHGNVDKQSRIIKLKQYILEIATFLPQNHIIYKNNFNMSCSRKELIYITSIASSDFKMLTVSNIELFI